MVNYESEAIQVQNPPMPIHQHQVWRYFSPLPARKRLMNLAQGRLFATQDVFTTVSRIQTVTVTAVVAGRYASGSALPSCQLHGNQ